MAIKFLVIMKKKEKEKHFNYYTSINDKHKDLIDNGYLFQPLAFEIQGAAGPSTEFFRSKLCKNLSISLF